MTMYMPCLHLCMVLLFMQYAFVDMVTISCCSSCVDVGISWALLWQPRLGCDMGHIRGYMHKISRMMTSNGTGLMENSANLNRLFDTFIYPNEWKSEYHPKLKLNITPMFCLLTAKSLFKKCVKQWKRDFTKFAKVIGKYLSRSRVYLSKYNTKLFIRSLSHAATMLYDRNVRILMGFMSLILLEFRVTQYPKGSRKRAYSCAYNLYNITAPYMFCNLLM